MPFPPRGEGSAPIAHWDVDVMLSELYAEFCVRCDLQVLYRGDKVQVVVVGTRTELDHFDGISFQAHRTVSIKSSKTLEQLIYQCLWDVFMQFDKWRGGTIPLPRDATTATAQKRSRGTS